jgi:2,3-dimethylmalate lyase
MSIAPAPTRRLRTLLVGEKAIQVPGAYDVLSARIIERAGFDAIYLGGAAAGASAFGVPDHSLITMTELVEHARRVTSAVQVPVIADLDDAGGTALNVRRFVRLAEQAGLAGVHIEDVIAGKHFTGHPDKLTEAGTFANRIRAAVEARSDDDFLIIARSDTRVIDDIVERTLAAVDVGADMMFLPYLRRRDIARLREATDIPLFQIGFAGLDPASTGAKIVVYPVHTLFASLRAVRDAVGALQRGEFGSLEDVVAEFNDLLGTPEATQFAERYGLVDASADHA